MSAYRRWGKRALDVAASAAGLALLSPLLAAVAAAIKLLDPGPVFFRQTRAGRGFKPFTIYKFRSMRHGASGLQITSDRDDRITPLGRLLRKTKIDELPQLLNVLLGDMSLVGPRPTVPKYAEMYRAQYEVILSVKPGITDWASVRFSDEEAVLKPYQAPETGYMEDILPEKMELYRRYIEEMTLLSDLRIIAATLLKVARRPEAPRGRPVVIRPLTRRERRLAIVAFDAAVAVSAYALAFLLRGDLSLSRSDWRLLVLTSPYAAASYLAASYYFGLHRGLRYYASFGDALDALKASAAAAVLLAALLGAAGVELPPAAWLLWPFLTLCGVTGLHAALRALRHHLEVHLSGAAPRRRAVVVGVGDLAELAYQNMRADEAVDYTLAAFVDLDGARCGVRLHGVPVAAGAPGLSAVLRREPVHEVVVAVARDRRARALEAVAAALQGLDARPDVRVMPVFDELAKEKRPEPRRVRPADLLHRPALALDSALIERSLAGKVVLVTGAGGMVGSELARQALAYRPRKLVLLDCHATSLFALESELRREPGGVELIAALGDVRDPSLLDRVFRDERPQVVLHAAAHKYVYQLETNIHEGVSNNLLGTYHLAGAADRHGAESFILVSTDKALRPTSVLAATKRAAEVVVSAFARSSKTRFASVRFGSVLGSAGSVLKVFQEQIEEGRPLTLSHQDAARYFMTAEEAAGLILQAAAMAKGGEVFSLKVGEQIPILDMARSLVRLSGLDPDRDVEIRCIGLKPGESPLDELGVQPGHRPTSHPGVTVVPEEDGELALLADRVLSLELLSFTAGKDAMVRALSQLVPSFSEVRLNQHFRIHPGSSPPPSPN